MPPTLHSVTASSRNCRRMSRRLAPSALRMPISRVRSVTERTHEIGIRKALGARRKQILWQFLLEAVVLCNIGGVLGVAVGFGLGNIVTLFTEFAVNIPWDWAVRGLLFCSAVGLVFGMWPAIRASRLSPVVAFSYE